MEDFFFFIFFFLVSKLLLVFNAKQDDVFACFVLLCFRRPILNLAQLFIQENYLFPLGMGFDTTK